jgi:hypothetical protein
MTIAIAGLLGDIEPQWNAQCQAVLGPRHGYIEKSSFFFDQSTKSGNGRRKIGKRNSEATATKSTKSTKRAGKPKATAALVDATRPPTPDTKRRNH